MEKIDILEKLIVIRTEMDEISSTKWIKTKQRITNLIKDVKDDVTGD